MTQAATEIRDLLAGRPGGVNRIIRRFGKPVLDYCTALIPDRREPFERMVEDILVDIIAQSRSAARARSDDEVFEFAIEAAMRTVRSRYRDALDAPARPELAGHGYPVHEVLERTGMSGEELTKSISEGRIRAIRAHDAMTVLGEDVPGLGPRQPLSAYHLPAAERELLCLHFGLGFAPETIALWAGETPEHIETLIDKAARRLSSATRGVKLTKAEPRDADLRRYVDGRADDDASARIEQAVAKNEIAQRRLEELRTQAQEIKAVFDSPAHDLSRVSVNVRARNPHHALSLPPSAALWIQIVGMAAMLLMFHRVGAYIAPPDVRADAVVGSMQLPPDGRLRVGESLDVPAAAQVLLVLDGSNRVLLAPETRIELRRPTEVARQALRLHDGEIWGRFTSAGHAFSVSLGDGVEIGGDTGADFTLAVNAAAQSTMPDNLHSERLRLLAAGFAHSEQGLQTRASMRELAGIEFGNDDGGLLAGDIILSVRDVAIETPEAFAAEAGGLAVGEVGSLDVLRGEQQLSISLQRHEPDYSAVLRVFHGSAVIDSPRGRFSVNRGQWALLSADTVPLIGRRGAEDFRALRISADERFKQALHWLDNESFPLRVENSVLHLDRGLREIAAALESRRDTEVQRDAQAEIIELERQLRETFEEARRRIERGEPNPRGEDPTALSDTELLESEELIMGILATWRRQSTARAYVALEDAGKTLSGPIRRDRATLATLDVDIGSAQARRTRIVELDEAVAAQDRQLENLRANDFHDPDGKARAELDSRAADLESAVRAGAQASGRLDLVRLKLNEVQSKIDERRRRLPGLKRALDEATAALAAINEQLAANIYTPERLAAAESALEKALATVAEARARDANRKDAAEAAQTRLAETTRTLQAAQRNLDEANKLHDEAQDGLADAIADRIEAQSKVDAVQKEVDRISTALEALEEDDPRRAPLEAQLKEATDALEVAEKALQAAKVTATAASKALEDATAAQRKAEAEHTPAEANNAAAKAISEAADAAAQQAAALLQQSLQTQQEAEQTLAAQQAAKLEREALQTNKLEAEAALEKATAALHTEEQAIEALEAEAEPRREEFRRENALVQAGDDARRALEDVHRERGRHQAISDDIARRESDRKILTDERDALQGSHLVQEYESMLAQYAELSTRIRAQEYLAERAFRESEIFKHKQSLAFDRFKEAEQQARKDATALLDAYCPPYDAPGYAVIRESAEPAALRKAALASLWTMYYDAGISDEGVDRPGPLTDAAMVESYFVLARSGARQEAFQRLDLRWRAYLAGLLGRQGYEQAGTLKPEHLLPRED